MEKITPVIPSRIRRYIPYLLGITLFSIYLYTTSPTVYLGDSGELTAAAFSLGIPHNSGYPLYSMLGKLFCLIPLGNIGFRMNLMSIFFSVLTVVLVYTIIFRLTASILASLVASALLAFTSLFWFQTVSAEVYPLHAFFVTLMIRVLLWWDEKREFRILALFVFITGLSFGNHMQTVMLAPAVLFFIISGDRKSIFLVKHFSVLTTLFLLALSLYIYLPIRTHAGAAIHWGDPDTLNRFWAHVSAQSHRGAYVFSTGLQGYIERSSEYLKLLWSQWGIVWAISIWGWLNLSSFRLRLFFVLVVIFDFIYTVFLNTISLEITPFGLQTLLVLAILFGVGLKSIFLWLDQQKRVGVYTQRAVEVGCVAIPIFAFLLNMALCNQSANYTAYEHGVNIFRTVESGSTILLEDDNNVFPALYGRITENMGEGVTLFDRYNLFFKWALDSHPIYFEGTWDELLAAVEKRIIKDKASKGVYFAAFNPSAETIPNDYRLIPYGILSRVVSQSDSIISNDSEALWGIYCTESLGAQFRRDYMNREVTGRYHFWRGNSLWNEGRRSEALRQFQLASEVAYDDTSLHSDLGVFFLDNGLFEKARKELEKALVYNEKLGGVYNNWGYYYYKKREYQKAIESFRKAVALDPKKHFVYNNLGFTMLKLGKQKEALSAFRTSLSIKETQPKIVELIKSLEER